MKQPRSLYDVFDECLDRIAGGEDLETCLKDYPQYAAQLKPLLETACTVRQAVGVSPRPEFASRAKAEFQAAVHEAGVKPRPRFFIWQPAWGAVTGIVLAIVLAGSFSVAAAGNSMPDEPLYPVKLATEQVRLALTPSPVAKAELSAELADKRVAEIINMAAKGEPDKVEVAVARLQQDLDRIASISSAKKQETAKTVIAPAVAQPAEGARPVPAPAAVPAPAPVPAPTPAVVPPPTLKAPAEDGKTLAAPTPRPSPVPVPSPAPATSLAPAPTTAPPTKTVPPQIAAASRDASPAGEKWQGESERLKKSDGSGRLKKSDESERLKESLARSAQKHPEELREALKKAQKESVKSALRKAIVVSEDGYKHARESLDDD